MPLSVHKSPEDVIKEGEEAFITTFGYPPEVKTVAPGRVNLIGEHTDYNSGFVLPMTLDMVTVMVSGRSSDNSSCVITLAGELNGSHIARFKILSSEDTFDPQLPKWAAYVLGVLATFQTSTGLEVPAFNAIISSSLPMGSGLSSSAALEVATHLTCQRLTNCSITSVFQVAADCRRAEHVWAGTPCGIMDQLVSLAGDAKHALFIDCQTLEFRHILMGLLSPQLDRGDTDALRLVLLDSGVHHKLADGEYAKRRAECEEASHLLEFDTLRHYQNYYNVGIFADSPDEVLFKDLQNLKEKLPPNLYKRAKHVITENQRTQRACKALQSGDTDQFGRLMLESHKSLRDDFEVSCRELDQLVELATGLQGVLGARMTGGGFGGCVVLLMRSLALNDLVARIDKYYSGICKVYIAEPYSGARILTK